jgi:hypothetical protein
MYPKELEAAAAAAGCPLHAHAAGVPAGLTRETELVLPMHKRVVAQYATGEAGGRELRLYYGDKEISFDEPELFAFGEALAQQSRFAAGNAAGWGEGYEWAAVKTLLEQLIETGILRYSAEVEPQPIAARDGARPSPLPPAETAAARTWFECEDVTRELTGRPLELGYLELVVPVFRVAHMSLDADGRQVGEANVFPPKLRLDVPTKWRTCIYAGTRFQQDRPMNVTALKAMRAQWPQMMAMLRRIREAYLARFRAARRGWTVGHLERLATCVLALPTYALMKSEERVENGELHPALSSLFRVTDGLRMTMHQMLFIPIGEPSLPPDAPMTREEIYAYAERNYSFHSEHGVCAGPQAMIREFLATLVDGKPAEEPVAFDPAVQAAMDDLEPAMDYGLMGLQAYAAVFSMWPIMTRAYESLAGIAAGAAPRSAAAERLRERLDERIERIRAAAFLSNEAWRADRERVYADMYAQCTYGLTGDHATAALAERIAPTHSLHQPPARATLRRSIARHFAADAAACAADIERMLDAIMTYLSQAQSVLRVACEAQANINRHLGRAQPARAFTAADIELHNRLQGRHDKRVPYLVSEIEALFGVQIALDEDTLVILEDGNAHA